MNDLLKKLAALGFLLLLVLWVVGVGRTFVVEPPELQTYPGSYASSFEDARSSSSLQVANNLKQLDIAPVHLAQLLDQGDINKIRIFEKTAQLALGTTQFSDDEARIRQALVNQKATVFSEKAAGIAPERSLVLGINVSPERFDALLQELNGVGQVNSTNVEQRDRTEEFRKLHGQRQSLRKYQEAIQKLRAMTQRSVEDALKLEQKLQEIDKELASIGVQMGDLLDKEPFYNLFVTLREHRASGLQDGRISWAFRLGWGFVWALGWWTAAVLGFGLLVGTYVSVRTLRPGR